MTPLGAVEIGGTNLRLGVGRGPDDLESILLPTGGPSDTVDAIADFFSHRPVAAVGVACFGPLQLDPESKQFGTILSTPKPGWSSTPLLEMLAGRLSVPVALDTDVNGAALGEGRWGATRGMLQHAYMTVGTGVGVGVVVAGEPIRRRHPEAGHVVVARLAEDTYPGNCPYHGDCLEGMASGPALEDRFGPPRGWGGDRQVLDLVSRYIAQGLRGLVYTTGVQRIVVGGGVSRLPGFHDRLRDELGRSLSDYPAEPDLELLVSSPGLGDLSGLAGALVVAERAMP